MALPKPSRSQFVVSVAAVIALAVVVALVWGFGQQLVLARQIRTEEIWLEQEVETEQARNDDLVAQLEYVWWLCCSQIQGANRLLTHSLSCPPNRRRGHFGSSGGS